MREYFTRLLGNGETKARLGRAIEQGRLPHALLIGGPSGSGKSIMAEEIAAALNCEHKNSPAHPLPCGECSFCKRIRQGNFADFKILKKKKDKATLGVVEIKDFREDMFLSATESESKVYIIDDAERMTVEAQNALLKVLEEPPKNVIIILLAKELDKILTTIKSRTQYLATTRFTDEEITEYLLKNSEDAKALYRENPDKLRAAVMSADGRIGYALELVTPRLAEDKCRDRDTVAALIRASITRSPYSELQSAISSLPEKRTELILSLELAISAVRDLIVTKEDRNAKTIFYTCREEAEKISHLADKKKLMALYDALTISLELCQKNANIGNLLADLSARIKFDKSVM